MTLRTKGLQVKPNMAKEGCREATGEYEKERNPELNQTTKIYYYR